MGGRTRGGRGRAQPPPSPVNWILPTRLGGWYGASYINLSGIHVQVMSFYVHYTPSPLPPACSHLHPIVHTGEEGRKHSDKLSLGRVADDKQEHLQLARRTHRQHVVQIRHSAKHPMQTSRHATHRWMLSERNPVTSASRDIYYFGILFFLQSRQQVIIPRTSGRNPWQICFGHPGLVCFWAFLSNARKLLTFNTNESDLNFQA